VNERDPSASLLTTSSNYSFMFAVGLTGIDMGSPYRYFDVNMYLVKKWPDSRKEI
jgi:hypothetical protein